MSLPSYGWVCPCTVWLNPLFVQVRFFLIIMRRNSQGKVPDIFCLPPMTFSQMLQYFALLVVLSSSGDVVKAGRRSGKVFIYSGHPGDKGAAKANTALMTRMLQQLGTGETLHVPNDTFWMTGGLRAVDLARDVTIVLDGTLSFLPGREGWPTKNCSDGHHNPLQPVKDGTCVQEAFFIANVSGLSLTSSEGMAGTLFGSGESWWGYLSYLKHGEDRPRLLSIVNGTSMLVERWRFEQSACWTFTAFDVLDLEIRHCFISNRVSKTDDWHDVWNLDAFNTDGFDVAGKNIHIHDSEVWNQDDCFTIQPLDDTATNAKCTENVLVENVNASGLGLTVGAIHPSRGHTCIRNITFRHARMHHTFKGIYIKSGSSFDPKASGEITNILYDDIVMDTPSQVPIWIGPAQEADSKGACSLLWPKLSNYCPPPPPTVAWTNITLRNIQVLNAKQSPGVVLGNPAQPMQGLLFDNVVFSPADSSKGPWGDKFYYCEGVGAGAAVNGSFPVPPCFDARPDVVI
ncbi:unnamed protein product [Prorocentrum cordatum]|uniref:Endo-polygalacturonase n=1 Tax=Prorocentrum cordatum TaxID=2364126 RepID=A0ABN9SU25_9DINO|nr:unnamed protein product [Polarella glacialis]